MLSSPQSCYSQRPSFDKIDDIVYLEDGGDQRSILNWLPSFLSMAFLWTMISPTANNHIEMTSFLRSLKPTLIVPFSILAL